MARQIRQALVVIGFVILAWIGGTIIAAMFIIALPMIWPGHWQLMRPGSIGAGVVEAICGLAILEWPSSRWNLKRERRFACWTYGVFCWVSALMRAVTLPPRGLENIPPWADLATGAIFIIAALRPIDSVSAQDTD